MNKAFIPAILYLVLFAYFYSFSAYGFNIWDEGSYAYGALRTYNGQTPMEDFNPRGYLPGRYYYGALFFKLFGVHMQSLRLGTVLFTPAMVLMVYAVARKIMPRGFAFLAALAMLSAPSMYYSRFYPFFCVLLLYGLIEYIESRRASWVFFLVASTVVGFFFKPEVALFSAVISAAVFATLFAQGARRPQEATSQPGGIRRAMVWGIALLSVGIAATLSVYAIRHDIPEKFLNLLWESHRVWGNPFPAILPFFKLLAELGPHPMFERVLFYLPVLVYFAVAGVLVARLVRLGWETTSLHLLVILSFGVCALGLVVWRAGFDNLLRTLPPFYILFCYLLSLVWKRLAARLNEQDAAAPVQRIALNVIIVSLPFLFYYEMNVHHGFYAGSVGAVSRETAPLRLNRVDVYTHPVEANWLKQLVARIRFYSRPGEPILALPLNPVFYFLTDRVNPTRHDWILPGMLDAKEQKKVVDQLAATPPKLIILADIAIDGKEERRFSRYAPVIFDFIARNYRRAEVIGFFQVLLPRNAGVVRLPSKQ
ncbi:MAG: ArnT family glycosyltransferase [Nitrospinales bacterium]